MQDSGIGSTPLSTAGSAKKRTHEEAFSVPEHPITIMRRSPNTLAKPNAVDVTSKSESKFKMLSPFHAHVDVQGKPVLRVPESGQLTCSVEGAWQGLKIFEKQGVDLKQLQNAKGKDLKRSERSAKRGKCLGHLLGDRTLGYVEARKTLYIPLYNQMLDLPSVQPLLEELYQRHLTEEGGLVLLDYYTNEDVEFTPIPLSHASLIKARLQRMFRERNGV